MDRKLVFQEKLSNRSGLMDKKLQKFIERVYGDGLLIRKYSSVKKPLHATIVLQKLLKPQGVFFFGECCYLIPLNVWYF
ncbi:hypothetical protein [Bacillus rubiinfantis]|uniref:hypothetical protein n=1 Tax=Bacillus rubiinfantis TaxID=1499680 RepID=UPI0005A945B3|nr:hypothetical protein [Bacillus rubiinfantis]